MVMIDTAFGWSASCTADELTIRLSGELDARCTGLLSERVKVEVCEVVSPRVVLDLEGVTFIDSSGIAFLMRTQRLVEEGDREFALRSLTGMPRDVLELTGVASRVTIDP